MSFTRQGSNSNLRKTRSLEEKGGASNDQWTASRSKKPASRIAKIANEILGLSAQSPSTTPNGTNRWSTSLQASSNLTRTHIIRPTTVDHSPRTQGIRLCDRNKARASANAQWSSGPKVAARSSFTIDAPPRHPLARNRTRSDKWDRPLDRFGHRPSQVLSQDESNPISGANARWHSSAGSLDLPRESTRYVPVRGLSRWDSSSSFTVASITSMDQLSTKPKQPKRRPLRGDSHKTKRSSSHRVNEQKTQVGTHTKETQGSPVTVGETAVNLETVLILTPISDEEATATIKTQQDAREENAPDASLEGCLKIDDGARCEHTCGRKDDSPNNQTHLRYALPMCTAVCFDTIPEEEVTEEDGIHALPALLQHDSILRAPKRRNSLLALTDDSGSSSLNSSALSTSFSRDASSSCMRDHSFCHKRRAEHDLSCYGPRQPKRRGSGGSPLLGVESSGSHSSLKLDECRYCMHRHAPGHHQASRCPHESPRQLSRKSSIGNDDKHPVSDTCRARPTAITASSASPTIKPITATRAPNLPSKDSFPMPTAMCEAAAQNKPARTMMTGKCPAA